MSIHEKEVLERFGHHHARVATCIINAQNTMRDVLLPRFPTAYPFVRRTMMWGQTAEELRKAFTGLPDARPVDASHQRFLLQVGPPSGALLFSIKHVDQDLRTANIPTQSALNFDRQIPIEGLPEGARLRIGYMLNRVETEVIAIVVFRKAAGRIAWRYEIPVQLATRSAAILPMHADVATQRFVAKKEEIKKSEDE